jgi:hypothetical protein
MSINANQNAGPRRHRAIPLWAHRTRRLSGYRRALGCAGVAAVGSDRGPGVEPAAGPFPDDGSPTRKRASSQRRDALWTHPQHQALSQEDDAIDDPIPSAR